MLRLQLIRTYLQLKLAYLYVEWHDFYNAHRVLTDFPAKQFIISTMAKLRR